MAVEGRIRLGMIGGGRRRLHRCGSPHRRPVGRSVRVCRRRPLGDGRPRHAVPARRSGLAPERQLRHFDAMLTAEAKRPDGIEPVAIVTPNHLHAPAALACLKADCTSFATSRSRRTLSDARDLPRCGDLGESRFRRHLQLFGLSDGPSCARDDRRLVSLATSGWCRFNTLRTG